MSEQTQGITVKKSEDISEWYTQVIQKAELADYSLVSGCIVYRPRSYAIWEKVQEFFDSEIKKLGVKNAYFPLLIPESLFKREAEHVEGFAPEVAWVTMGGNSPLNERLAVRPTSETIMYESYSKWIKSYRDLPLKINQWCNIVRWEFKHPMPFIRGREFLWQEGHTVFATKEEADKEVMDILDLYHDVHEKILAVPGIKGQKAHSEKFAGADYSMSVESFMPSGKGLQSATSHHLGQNFAKSFNISFLNESGESALPYQNSWGISTRLLGAMIMTHGDDKGVVIPPKVASLHVVIVPILFEATKKQVLDKCSEIKRMLEKSNISVHLDDRDNYSAGWKFSDWELKGVCLRIELGPKDLEKSQCVVVRRDTGVKTFVKLDELTKVIPAELDKMQSDMLIKAKKFVDENTVHVKSWSEFSKAVEDKKMIYAPWCCEDDCAAKIKQESGAKSLTLPLGLDKPKDKCFKCLKDSKHIGLFAKSY